jgi:hypothetical protein
VFTTYETQYDVFEDRLYYLKLDEGSGLYGLHALSLDMDAAQDYD